MVRLLVNFSVRKADEAAFESFCKKTYLPLLARQKGFVRTSLGRLYGREVLQEIGAEVPAHNYHMTIEFDGEAARREWVASPEHDPAWAHVVSLTDECSYTGYDIVAEAGPAPSDG